MTDENEKEDEVQRPFPWQELLQNALHKEWFTWAELLESGGLLDFELIGYIKKKGLQPYLPPGNSIHCPYKWHLRIFYLKQWQGAIRHYLSTEEAADWLNNMRALLQGSGDESEDGRILVHPDTKERFLLVKDDEKIFSSLVREGLYEQFRPNPGGWGVLLSQETLKKIWDRVGVLNKEETLTEEMARLVVADPGLNAKPRPTGLKWEFLAMPSTQEELHELIEETRLEEAIFKREDLKTLAAESGVELKAGEEVSPEEEADDVVVLIEEKKQVVTIDKKGNPHVKSPRWRVKYRGEAATISSFGMNCYAKLYELAEENPDTEPGGISPPALQDLVLGRKAPEKTQAEEEMEQEFPATNVDRIHQRRQSTSKEDKEDSPSGYQVRDSDRKNMDLTKEDGENLRQTYSRLKRENPAEAKKAVEELAKTYGTSEKRMWLFLEDKIGIYNISGKDKKFESAKKSIQKAMGTARSQLQGQKLGDLADYLENHFSYQLLKYQYKPPEQGLKFKITWHSD
jgi:hypothetical protein